MGSTVGSAHLETNVGERTTLLKDNQQSNIDSPFGAEPGCQNAENRVRVTKRDRDVTDRSKAGAEQTDYALAGKVSSSLFNVGKQADCEFDKRFYFCCRLTMLRIDDRNGIELYLIPIL